MNPETLARTFLSHMERRELDEAEALLAPGFQMTFPSGVKFSTISELIEWARPRYRRIAKRIERVEVADDCVVIVQGTLIGEWPDGQPFEGIRFVDWFEIRDGLIREQRVWNDLAEFRRDN